MWQFYAMMAQDQINEQLNEAEIRRRNHERPLVVRPRRRLHLPTIFRQSVRPSSRSV